MVKRHSAGKNAPLFLDKRCIFRHIPHAQPLKYMPEAFMRFENLPTPTRQEVQQALLPGEEVRYITRPKAGLAAVLRRGGWALFAFGMCGNAVVLAVFGFFTWAILTGRGSGSLLMLYAVMLLFFLCARLVWGSAVRESGHLKRSLYLVTTRRVMILRLGDTLLAWPLHAGIIRQVEVQADGSGFLFFRTDEKEEDDETLDTGCFAFVPEVRRVESLINELVAQLRPLPEMELPAPDMEVLEPLYRSRLQKALEPGEQVLWVGRSLPLRQVMPQKERLGLWFWGLVHLSGCICACVAGCENWPMWILAALYLVCSGVILLMLFGHDQSAYAITNRRVCYVRPGEVLTFSHQPTAMEHRPCGAVSISLKSSGSFAERINAVSGLLPLIALLSNQTQDN